MVLATNVSELNNWIRKWTNAGKNAIPLGTCCAPPARNRSFYCLHATHYATIQAYFNFANYMLSKVYRGAPEVGEYVTNLTSHNISTASLPCRPMVGNGSIHRAEYGADMNLENACYGSHHHRRGVGPILSCVPWGELFSYARRSRWFIPSTFGHAVIDRGDPCRPLVVGQQGYGFFYQDSCANSQVAKRMHNPLSSKTDRCLQHFRLANGSDPSTSNASSICQCVDGGHLCGCDAPCLV